MAQHRVTIADTHTNNAATVTKDGALITTLSPTLGVEQSITIVPRTLYITINGIPQSKGGTNALLVDGSVTPVEAFVRGQQEGDFYITTANVLIADAGVISLNRFGGQAALINGIDLFYDISLSADTFGEPIKTNFDFIRLGSLTQAVGGKTDAFQLANSDPANNDGYNPVLDLSRLSPFNTGIRLRKNSNDKLGIRINDDLTGISTFNILLIGFLRLIVDEERTP